MRQGRRISIVLVATALTMLAIPAATAGQLDQASGSGQLRPGRAFAFSAVELQDGTVTGQGQLSFYPGPFSIHFSIDCLNVQGNIATMSGKVTQSSGFGDVTGAEVWFQVEDNGQGKNADSDLMTYLPVEGLDEGDVPGCDDDDYTREDGQTDLVPILTGNIKVTG